MLSIKSSYLKLRLDNRKKFRNYEIKTRHLCLSIFTLKSYNVLIEQYIVLILLEHPQWISSWMSFLQINKKRKNEGKKEKRKNKDIF